MSSSSEPESEYEVEDIVDCKWNEKTKKIHYRVRWKGFNSEEDTWEPEEHVNENSQEFLKKWRKKSNQIKRAHGIEVSNVAKRSSPMKEQRSSDDDDAKVKNSSSSRDHRFSRATPSTSTTDDKHAAEKGDINEPEKVLNEQRAPRPIERPPRPKEERPLTGDKHTAGKGGLNASEKAPSDQRASRLVGKPPRSKEDRPSTDDENDDTAPRVQARRRRKAPRVIQQSAEVEEKLIDNQLKDDDVPEKILGVTPTLKNRIAYLVQFKNKSLEEVKLVRSEVLANKCPQLIISYFETKLRFSKIIFNTQIDEHADNQEPCSSKTTRDKPTQAATSTRHARDS